MSHIVAGGLTQEAAEVMVKDLNDRNSKCRAIANKLYPNTTWSVSMDVLAAGTCAAAFEVLGHHVTDHGSKVKPGQSCAKMQRCNGTGQIQHAERGQGKMKLIACPGCDECPDDEEEDN